MRVILDWIKKIQSIRHRHWYIENKQSWILVATFNEVLGTKQAGTAPENFSTLIKIVLKR